MGHAISVLGAVLAAVVTVFVSSAVEPADDGVAATGGYVATCGGGR